MKKSFIFVAVLVAVTVCTGFFMPGVISGMQNSGFESEVSRYEAPGSKLMLSEPPDQLDKLKLMSGDVSVVKVEEGKNLTSTQAERAAFELVASTGFWTTNDYKKQGDISIKTFVRTSRENAAVSAIIWQCTIEYEGNNVTIYLDDYDSMIMGFSCQISQGNNLLSSYYKNADKTEARGMSSELCRYVASEFMNYYGFVDYNVYELSYDDDSSDEMWFRYNIVYEKEDGTSCELMFTTFLLNGDVTFSFNC